MAVIEYEIQYQTALYMCVITRVGWVCHLASCRVKVAEQGLLLHTTSVGYVGPVCQHPHIPQTSGFNLLERP